MSTCENCGIPLSAFENKAMCCNNCGHKWYTGKERVGFKWYYFNIYFRYFAVFVIGIMDSIKWFNVDMTTVGILFIICAVLYLVFRFLLKNRTMAGWYFAIISEWFTPVASAFLLVYGIDYGNSYLANQALIYVISGLIIAIPNTIYYRHRKGFFMAGHIHPARTDGTHGIQTEKSSFDTNEEYGFQYIDYKKKK